MCKIIRRFLLATLFLLIPLYVHAQFEAQAVQVCDGASATKMFLTASGSSSGDWELYNLSSFSVMASGSDGDYLEVTGLTFGHQLEIRDANNSAEKATIINNGNTTIFFVLDDGGPGSVFSCENELVCPAGGLFDLVERNEAAGFSTSNKNGILASFDLDGDDNGSFNAVIFGDFTSTDGTGDTEGRLAVENNFTASGGYTVGQGFPTATGGLNAPFGWDNLVVGGNMDYAVSGGVRGNVLYENNVGSSLPGFIGIGSGSSSGMYRNLTPDLDWNRSEEALRDLSLSISPANITIPHSTGSVSSTGSTITLDGLNQSGLVVFNLSTLPSSVSFNFVDVDAADALLVNVPGSSFSLTGGSISLNGTIQNFPFLSGDPGTELIEKTLWNFYEATAFSLDGYLLTGSVLAPFTNTVTLNGGNINGQSVFSGTVTQGGGFEFHNFCFQSSDFLPEQFTLTGGPCWRTLSSPIQTLHYSELLAELWTQSASGADATGGQDHIFTFNSVGDDWEPLNNLNQQIPAGTGILISVFTDDEFGIPGSWNKYISIGGTEHPSPVSVPTSSMASGSDGFTLLGNPFKVPIRFDDLNLNDVESTVWVYDRNASGTLNGNQGNWISWSGGVGDITDGIIDPFQGFVVRNDDSPSAPSVVFPEASKTTGGDFYGKQDGADNYIRFEVSSENSYNSAWIRFSDKGSFDLTSGDAEQLLPLENSYTVISTIKSRDTLTDIGHFPFPQYGAEIPLHIESTLSGRHVLSVTDFSLTSTTGYLEFVDLQKNLVLPLDDDFHYEFQFDGSQTKRVDNPGALSCDLKGPELAKANTPVMAKAKQSDRFIIRLAEEAVQDETPSNFKLNQNFPNPFNPVTQISYELPQQSDVLLEVYDMTGRQIATLVNETVAAGSHQVSFDAGNLSSGVYLYRLTAGNQVFSRKLTVIK